MGHTPPFSVATNYRKKGKKNILDPKPWKEWISHFYHCLKHGSMMINDDQ